MSTCLVLTVLLLTGAVDFAVQMLDHQGIAQRELNLRTVLPKPIAMLVDTSAASVLNSEALTGRPATVRLRAALAFTVPDTATGPHRIRISCSLASVPHQLFCACATGSTSIMKPG